MSKILDHAQSARCLADIKSAMREVGCDLCDVDDLSDVANAIRKQCVTGPNAVINAMLASGPGIKITPIDRKGYRISANDEAVLSGEINGDLPKGTSVHKALFHIVNKLIPEATKEAAGAPVIVDASVFRTEYDGIDYYNNKAFGRQGNGRKTGLRPNTWYLKIVLFAQLEPLYISLGPAFAELKREILDETKRMCLGMIDRAMSKHEESFHMDLPGDSHHPERPNRPNHRPGHVGNHRPFLPKPDESFGGFGGDEGFTVDTEENNNNCDLCNPADESFGGFGGDEGFEVTPGTPSRPSHKHKHHHTKPELPEDPETDIDDEDIDNLIDNLG